MAYSVKSKKSGKEYFLHGGNAKNGKTMLYFFRGAVTEGAIETLPDGYEVSENTTTGLPILKKKK